MSISLDLWKSCRMFCENYSMAFSKLVRNALIKYLSEIKKDSKKFEMIRLIAKLEKLEEKSKMIRKHRNAMIRNGSGIKEIKELRVSGVIKRGFDPVHAGYSWTKGRIKDPEERKIYGELCDILEELNKERKEILCNPLFVKWLKEG